ncbi:MAG: P63C domain-containing protein [Paraclostridium sp.]
MSENNICDNEIIVNNEQSTMHMKGITAGIMKFKKFNEEEGFIDVPCAVVKNNDGETIRVINGKGLFNAFDRTAHGATRVPGLPAVVGSKTLASLMSEEDLAILEPITYEYGEKIYTGYNAEALIVMIRAYIKAEEKGILKPQQLNGLRQAKVILLDLAGQGIKALVDKATGFIYEEEINALDSLIKELYMNDEPIKNVASIFPRDFYREVFRIHGWNFNPASSKRPGYVGTFTKKYVWGLLPDTVVKEIENRNPTMKDRNYNYRKNKYYHYLTVDTGIKELDDAIKGMIKVMKLSEDKHDFYKKYEIAFEEELRNKNQNRPLQLSLNMKPSLDSNA